MCHYGLQQVFSMYVIVFESFSVISNLKKIYRKGLQFSINRKGLQFSIFLTVYDWELLIKD